jgi:hypothetical protein
LKDVKVTECPPEKREKKYRGEAPAAELLRTPTGGYTAQELTHVLISLSSSDRSF